MIRPFCGVNTPMPQQLPRCSLGMHCYSTAFCLLCQVNGNPVLDVSFKSIVRTDGGWFSSRVRNVCKQRRGERRLQSMASVHGVSTWRQYMASVHGVSTWRQYMASVHGVQAVPVSIAFSRCCAEIHSPAPAETLAVKHAGESATGSLRRATFWFWLFWSDCRCRRRSPVHCRWRVYCFR